MIDETSKEIKTIHKYTKLQYLIDFIKTGKFALTDPLSWEDKNDVRFLEFFQNKKQLERMSASCFTRTAETFHHWKIYAEQNKGPGVRISFDKKRFVECLNEDFLYKEIKYIRINGENYLSGYVVDDLPFIKRYPYRDEREYRDISPKPIFQKRLHKVNIDVSVISGIRISPWMERNEAVRVKEDLNSKLQEKWHKIKNRIFQSTMLKNDKWIELGQNIIL